MGEPSVDALYEQVRTLPAPRAGEVPDEPRPGCAGDSRACAEDADPAAGRPHEHVPGRTRARTAARGRSRLAVPRPAGVLDAVLAEAAAGRPLGRAAHPSSRRSRRRRGRTRGALGRADRGAREHRAAARGPRRRHARARRRRGSTARRHLRVHAGPRRWTPLLRARRCVDRRRHGRGPRHDPDRSRRGQHGRLPRVARARCSRGRRRRCCPHTARRSTTARRSCANTSHTARCARIACSRRCRAPRCVARRAGADAYADTPRLLWPLAERSLRAHLDKLVRKAAHARSLRAMDGG